MSIDDLRAKSRALRNSRLPTYLVTMRSYGGVRVRGWLTIPKGDRLGMARDVGDSNADHGIRANGLGEVVTS